VQISVWDSVTAVECNSLCIIKGWDAFFTLIISTFLVPTSFDYDCVGCWLLDVQKPRDQAPSCPENLNRDIAVWTKWMGCKPTSATDTRPIAGWRRWPWAYQLKNKSVDGSSPQGSGTRKPRWFCGKSPRSCFALDEHRTKNPVSPNWNFNLGNCTRVCLNLHRDLQRIIGPGFTPLAASPELIQHGSRGVILNFC